MAFIGNQPVEQYSSIAKQDITGNGGTSYTLNATVTSPEDIEVFINNVRQEPGVSYSVSNTTLTLTEALLSTDDCYVVYQGRTVGTRNPPDDSVSFEKTTFADSITGALTPPKGTTAQRPSSPVDGMIRYNTTLNVTEEYRSGAWRELSNPGTRATTDFSASGGTETTITQNGKNYKVHTFLSSGNFVVSAGSSTVEYLVVAGGGAGATQHSGGGGAGGFRTNVYGAISGGGHDAEAAVTVSAGTYAVTVGAGGAKNTSLGNGNGTRGNGGGNSSIAFTSAITSIGGGVGGRYNNLGAGSGGSGGGGGTNTGTGAAGTSGQGFGGGNGLTHASQYGGGGGGGGAGAPGETYSGHGGIGVQSFIDGTNYYYAGGGGGARVLNNGLMDQSGDGGEGGGGGGGDGSTSDCIAGKGGYGRNVGGDGGNGNNTNANSTGGDGGANTGGGGGSSGRWEALAGNGGSGIVIIRYET